MLHPTINVQDPEEGVDTRVICANDAQRHDAGVALSNSFGFGGHNSCVLFRKYQG
jgi:3-oxoacyl-[acyl-carrier-protein] synthase II